VISRCQRYEFKRIGIPDLLERLRRIVADEAIEATEGALFAIAREADGSMRDAQSLLDQAIVFAGKALTEADVQSALGVADRTILHRVTDAIMRRDAGPCLRAVDELYRYGYEVPRFCRDLVQQFRNLTVAALFGDPTMLADLADHEVAETMRQAALRTPDDLQRLFRVVQVGTEEARKSALPKLVLEMTLVKMATMPDAPPVDELLGRLEEMERRLAGGGGEPPAGRGPDGRSRAAVPARTQAPASAPMRADAAPVRADAAPLSASVVASAAPAVVVPATGSGWETFLATAQAKVSLRMSLLDSQPLEESAERLHIGLASELAERALRSEISTLTELATHAYGGPRRVELSVVRPAAPTAAPATAAARTRELADRARSSPTVRSAVDILGGEITDVRPRSRGGEP
jgi:DNA polymerase III subunit gamma/tau